MRFAAIYQSFMGGMYRRNVDTGRGPMNSSMHYWQQFTKSPLNERDQLLCLIRLDSPPNSGEPEVIVNGTWSDDLQGVV